jgi:transposase-like protein
MQKTEKKYSLAAHNERFPSNESCEDFLRVARWSDGPKCPECKNAFNNYFITKRNLYQCFACNKQFNVLTGTIFKGSRVKLTQWFQAIYFFTIQKRGLSSVQLSKYIGVTQKTAWIMLQKLRIALDNEGRTILNGIVECDEMFINANVQKDMRLGKKKMLHDRKMEWRQKKYFDLKNPDGEAGKRGRKKGHDKKELERIKELQEIHPIKAFGNERVVFGMHERNGKLVLRYIKGAKSEEILPNMMTHINKEATIMTDDSNIYFCLKHFFKDHKSINHKERKFANEDIYTNSIENVFRHLRIVIRGTYCDKMSNKHLQLYLDECSFRWSHRHSSENEIFDAFLEKVVGMKHSYEMIKYYDGNMAA